MRNFNLFIAWFILFSSVLQSQTKQLEKANRSFAQFSYIDAREAYLEVVKKGYVSQDVIEKIADSYYFNAELSEASEWYARLYKEYKDSIDSEYLFRYSQTLKSIEDYSKADQIMEEYNKLNGNERRSELFDDARNYLSDIAIQSGRFKIQNLKNINTEGSDFGPSFYSYSSIVFASSGNESPYTKTLHQWNEAIFLDLYETKRVSKTSLNVEGLKKLNSKINTRFHESSTAFTKDGLTVYFTRNNFTDKKVGANQEGTSLLKLYKATREEDGNWDNVVELPFNSNDYSVAHPALSSDETKLYFASDMPGTFGQSDIFVVDILGNNKYSEPENLGEYINTEGRETFPFISKSGKLFFASDGHPGLGGLDVFLAMPNEIKISYSKFKPPYNIGAPVNSPQDDFSFIIEEQSKIGFFTSNRPGGKGADDIYSLKQIKDVVTGCNQTVEGLITDANTQEIITDAVVTLFDNSMNKIDITTSNEFAKYSLGTECEKSYVLRAEKQGYAPKEINIVTNDEYDEVLNAPIELTKGEKPIGITKTQEGDDLAEVLQINPIYFDLDKSSIRYDAEIELQKVIAIMKQYPKMEIDVRSHADSRASFKYNVALSNRRVKNTIKYLVEKGGIEPERLTGRGYGEIRLINDCADGVNCSENDHQKNRRSEFIIMSY